MTPGRRLHQCAILIIVIALALTAGACGIGSRTDESALQGEHTAPTTTVTLETDIQQPSAPSGELRLWWSSRETLNPLLDDSESGQAVNRLIFDGLFQIDHDQQIQPGLANRLVVLDDSDGRVVDIYLTADNLFHNGLPVTADDVKANLDFILENSERSPFAASLADISASEVIADNILRLILNRPSPWLAYALNFPVIPAASLTSAPYDLVPGTGLFQMSGYSANDGLILTRNRTSEQPGDLENIRVRTYDNLTEALKALSDDQIDLLNLPPDQYDRYRMRDSLRFEQYAADEIIFLAYNTNYSRILSDDGRLLYVKKLLTADSPIFSGREGEFYPVNLPMPADSFLIEESSSDYRSILSAVTASNWPDAPGLLTILTPEHDRVRSWLATAIAGLLAQSGIETMIVQSPEASFSADLLSGQYDIAVLKATLPPEPDPTWLYGPRRPVAYEALGRIEGEGLQEENRKRGR